MDSTLPLPKSEITPRLGRVWLVLLAGPVLFLLAILIASIYFGVVAQGDVAATPALVAASTPYQLVGVQLALLFVLRWAMKRDGLAWNSIGWRAAAGQRLWRELLIGSLPGAALGLLYVFVLSPLQVNLQRLLGDYVPAGELLPALSSALTRLQARFSKPAAILLSCLFFGLLHWAGGFWYILLTGLVAGGLFAILFTVRKSILAPYAAHLALNVVEFLFTWMVLP